MPGSVICYTLWSMLCLHALWYSDHWVLALVTRHLAELLRGHLNHQITAWANRPVHGLIAYICLIDLQICEMRSTTPQVYPSAYAQNACFLKWLVALHAGFGPSARRFKAE
jgi:hypothetical protein